LILASVALLASSVEGAGDAYSYSAPASYSSHAQPSTSTRSPRRPSDEEPWRGTSASSGSTWSQGSGYMPAAPAVSRPSNNFAPDDEPWQTPGYGESDTYESEPNRYAPEPLDAVASMRQTFHGKAAVALSAGIWGAGLASAISASTVDKPVAAAVVGVVFGALISFMSGNFGELLRALGVSLILTLQRSGTLKQQYPLLTQVKAVVVRRRRRFPPNAPKSLWKYSPSPESPVQFSMSRAILAAGFLGSMLGYMAAKAINMFILPPWLLALASCGMLVYSSTMEASQGDLVRCLSMKCVGLAGLVIDAAGETKVAPKSYAVAGQLGKKMNALDAKYKIKDKVFAVTGKVFSGMAGAAQRMQGAEGPDEGPKEGRRGQPSYEKSPYRHQRSDYASGPAQSSGEPRQHPNNYAGFHGAPQY